MPIVQWAEGPDGTSYTPVGVTVKVLEPGYYDLTADNTGKPYFIPVRARTDELIRFPDSASLEVLQGISGFWEREKQFIRYGLPYKRGILLYGPPGSGKTCTLQLVARDVVERGGVVFTFNPSIFLTAYRAFRDIQPETPMVVLMEDLEALVKRSDESRLLNLLDGVEDLHKVVFVASTNYPELLQERITNRPSRFDIMIKVAHPSDEARRLYLESLILDGDELDVERYVKDTKGMSLAHVKELFVGTHILGSPYEEVVERIQAMAQGKTSKDDKVFPNPFGGGGGGVGSYL